MPIPCNGVVYDPLRGLDGFRCNYKAAAFQFLALYITSLAQGYQGGIRPYTAADFADDGSVSEETAETTSAGVPFGCKIYSAASASLG